MGLVPGVVLLNALLLAVGYALLSPAIAGRRLREQASYAGLALLAGAGAAGVVLAALAVAGATVSLPLAVGVAALLAALGVAARFAFARSRARIAPMPATAQWPRSLAGDAAATAATLAIGAIAAFALVGAFRASPWIDDAWAFWLPKGLALREVGLDPRVFTVNTTYEWIDSPDYPLWWPIVTSLDMTFVGEVDLRAINAQLTALVLAFLGATARLLWGLVRPAILLPSLLLLAAAPELLRQSQGGGADLPLACYLVLFLVTGARWLLAGEAFGLGLAGLFGASAVAIKSEGAPELLIFAAVLSLFGLALTRRRLVALWLAVACGYLASAPWFLWKATNGIRNDVSFSDAVDPSYLLDRTERIRPALEEIGLHLVNPREWLVIVPLLLILSLLAVVRTRRAVWLAPAAALVVGYAFLVWVNWADRHDLGYRLSTASYRIVVPLLLLSAVSIPVLAEHVVRSGRSREPPGVEPEPAGALR
jgi:hypothetical protein